MSGGQFEYSVAQLLDDVKYDFDDTFTKDVYDHFGMQRRESKVLEPLRYQNRTENTTNRELLASALESTIDTSTEEGQEQIKRLKEYKSSIKRISTLETQRSDLVDKGMELMRKKGKFKRCRL